MQYWCIVNFICDVHSRWILFLPRGEWKNLRIDANIFSGSGFQTFWNTSHCVWIFCNWLSSRLAINVITLISFFFFFFFTWKAIKSHAVLCYKTSVTVFKHFELLRQWKVDKSINRSFFVELVCFCLNGCQLIQSLAWPKVFLRLV